MGVGLCWPDGCKLLGRAAGVSVQDFFGRDLKRPRTLAYTFAESSSSSPARESGPCFSLAVELARLRRRA